jgi:hypothetical protein
LKGYVVAYDGKSGSQAFRAKRKDALLASLDIFFVRGSMEPHPDVTEWRVWDCPTGRDITLQLSREREAKLATTIRGSTVGGAASRDVDPPDLLGDVPE